MGTARIACALLIAMGARAHADCPTDAAARTDAIRAHLDREARRAHRWDLGWGLGFGAAAIAQGAMGATRWQFGQDVTDDVQVGLYIGAGKSAIAALSHVVLPLHIPRVGPATADPCADLDGARRALARARREERQVFWLSAAGTIGLNGGGLLIAGWGYGAWREGVITSLLGLPVGAINMLTMPRGSWRGAGVTLDVARSSQFTGVVVRGAF